MKILLIIGIGSFMGGVLRYLISVSIQTRFLATFPYATLSVNIIGCFLIGILLGLSDRMVLSNEVKLFLSTGLLGGFTTFSAFSAESVALLRVGHTSSALTYIALSLLFGLLATFIGLIITRIF